VITAEQKDEALKNISTHSSLQAGVKDADLVIEAATENIEIKLKIFKDIDEYAAKDAILATNTSSISITKIAAVTQRPEKVIGMHFMNPVPVMKLVEIINGYATDQAVTDQIVEATKILEKVPCVVNDYPGFVANRILMP
jgi:3-hydroxybutyryl-CoA dehydrogenase